ncbi:hypothetical protein [Alcaligenes parafaecalis]|uniref:HNH endonuclease n=1 Tax=Alcaligenes parafaecalis TaxID=171260 RepID=A0ABT3VI23_9BURK|nr:hypothetical protein [Alcaligenes parafaecalis]MCX5463147.1 hypothetical protein [Alcaligenes parafaecalis]
MIIEIHDVWVDAAARHEAFLRDKVAVALQSERDVIGPESLVVVEVGKFIDRNLDVIVDAATRDFTGVVDDFTATFSGDQSFLDGAKTKFKAIFNYEAFISRRNGWGAYALCSAARYKVCPYCHIRTTSTVARDEDHAGYRPQLDHYYDKARYPFLALSLGNLVPCCGRCNGPGMKHNKDFVSIPHLNPLRDVGVLTFDLAPKNGREEDPALKALRFPAEHFEVRINAPADNQSAQNSLRTFQLRSQYQEKLHDAYRVAKIGRSPAFERSIEIATGLDVHDMTIADHLGFDPNGDHYKGLSAGKMLRDVYLDSQNW